MKDIDLKDRLWDQWCVRCMRNTDKIFIVWSNYKVVPTYPIGIHQFLVGDGLNERY